MKNRINEGSLIASGLKIGIIISRFNEIITNKLLNGCLDCLLRHGINSNDIEQYWVPGAFEIPLVAKKVLNSRELDAVICIGAVIRGATPHFEYVSSEVSKGIAKISLDFGKPVIFGVLTTDTIEQALERSGSTAGNKGYDAALTAIETANLIKNL